MNSLIIGVMAALAVTLSSAFVAFGFAYFRFPGRNLVFGLVLATMMLPAAVTMIPNYLVWNWLGLTGIFRAQAPPFRAGFSPAGQEHDQQQPPAPGLAGRRPLRGRAGGGGGDGLGQGAAGPLLHGGHLSPPRSRRSGCRTSPG